MKVITSYEVRLEGDVNIMWDFRYSDGTSESYYAYEGSAQEESTDRRVYEYDPKLDMFLELLAKKCSPPDDEFGAVDYEFDRYHQITKVTQQAAD